MRSRAIVLLSGGLDSTTCLAWAQANYECIALSFMYGQRSTTELDAAKILAQRAGVEHRVINIDLGNLGGSALTDHNIEVPEQLQEGIPVTYVPARNTIFLSYALAAAEVFDAEAIVIGVNAVDYSGYPDCRPEFIDAFANLARLATKAGVEGKPLKIETYPAIRQMLKDVRVANATVAVYVNKVSSKQVLRTLHVILNKRYRAIIRYNI